MKPGAPRPIVQPTPDPRVQPVNASQLSQPLVLATLAYALGQLSNFLFQLRLLDQLGPSQYAEAGLAHLLLITLIFLADLGYSSLFLREVRDSANWRQLWRYALGHRLLATFVLLAVSMLVWPSWGGTGASQDYLIWAAPACVLALFNYSSPMIAEGRRLAGLLVAQVAWPVALMIWLLLPTSLLISPAAKAGLAFSLGYLIQALLSMACSRQLRIWLPLAGKGHIGAAMRMSMIGISGTLHDRLAPFLLAPLVPSFMPWLLILNHVLSGLSGIQAQLARLLMPKADTAAGKSRILDAASLLLWATPLMLLSITLLQGMHLFAEQRLWLQPVALLVLAWGISASSGLFAILLIRLRREGPLLKLMVAGTTGSALLQLVAAWNGSVDGVLWARVLGMVVIAAGLLSLLELRVSAWGWTACGLSLLACVAGGTHFGVMLGVALLFAVVTALLRRAPCYHFTSHAGLSQ